MKIEAIVAELYQNYHRVKSPERCTELIGMLIENEDIIKKLSLKDLKIITKVSTNLLENDPGSFPYTLEKIYHYHDVGITKAIILERDNNKKTATIRAHLAGHKGTVAHIQYKRTGEESWAESAYRSYMDATNNSFERKFAFYSYKSAAELAKRLYVKTQDRKWVRRWFASETNMAELASDERRQALIALATGEDAIQVYKKTHDRIIKEYGMLAFDTFLAYCWKHPYSEEERRVTEVNSKKIELSEMR